MGDSRVLAFVLLQASVSHVTFSWLLNICGNPLFVFTSLPQRAFLYKSVASFSAMDVSLSSALQPRFWFEHFKLLVQGVVLFSHYAGLWKIWKGWLVNKHSF